MAPLQPSISAASRIITAAQRGESLTTAAIAYDCPYGELLGFIAEWIGFDKERIEANKRFAKEIKKLVTPTFDENEFPLVLRVSENTKQVVLCTETKSFLLKDKNGETHTCILREVDNSVELRKVTQEEQPDYRDLKRSWTLFEDPFPLLFTARGLTFADILKVAER